MPTILDRSQEEEVARLLLELMEESGYPGEEFIPGLILAARLLASKAIDPEVVRSEIYVLMEDDDE